MSITFKPKKITMKLIAELPERARDVLVKRFGIGDSSDIMTLEAIGQQYGITRERVRQIENQALSRLRRSEIKEAHEAAFQELVEVLLALGGVVSENHLFEHISPKKDVQNHVNLLLTLSDEFERERENNKLAHRWHLSKDLEQAIAEALDRLHENLGRHELVTEQEVINRFIEHLENIPEGHAHHAKNEDVLKRWLSLSKRIDKNPLNEWGRASSPNVKVKGIRDYAYLVLRDHGSPLHFTEVTDRIQKMFGKEAHVATTHNELIKDSRFVLVGRGLYALKDWGYMTGVVRDVIRNVLDEHGPLNKDEVIEKVMKERYVKPNTVIVNLQDSDHFVKLDDGRYTVA